jgi:hypothetical protein
MLLPEAWMEAMLTNLYIEIQRLGQNPSQFPVADLGWVVILSKPLMLQALLGCWPLLWVLIEHQLD